MGLRIATGDPSTPEVIALLETHLDLMRAISPPGSVHALDINALCGPDITFWTVHGDLASGHSRTESAYSLVGCGALKALDARHGEIKSMHVREAARGRGIAVALLMAILREAKARGLARLSLETGSTEHFAPARRLYTAHGFAECGPFADYAEDWHSTFMTLDLTQIQVPAPAA